MYKVTQALLVGCVLFTGQATLGDEWYDDKTGITWTYNVYNGMVSLGGGTSSSIAVSTSTTGTITIPSNLGGYVVTRIGDNAFLSCSGLNSVTIPDSVTSIGYSAFYGCSGLTNIVFEGNVPSVGSGAFTGVDSGCVVFVPRGSTGWGVEIPGTWNGLRIEYIEEPDVALGTWTSDFALAREYADKNSIPMLVYWTNQGCHYCQTLEKDVFESGQFAVWCQERQLVMVYSQGDATVKQFARNSSGAYPFVAVYWNKGNGEEPLLVKFTGRDGMMPWKWGTLAVQFINSVDSVLGNKEIQIPAYIVDDGVLIYVSPGLTEFEIPADVVEIGYKAFDGCTSLTNVVIPVGVNQIGSSAFRGCSGLTSVTIPDSVTSIGDYAFSGCSGLTNITIGSGVTNIGNYAFYNCSELTSVTIPDNVTSIGYSAFSGCKGLTHVMLGSGVISIGEEAFSGCVGVQDFIVDASNRSYKSSNGFLLTAEETSILYAPEGQSEIVIPNGITRIGRDLFAGRENLTSVTMPDSVTIIEDGAFSDCYSLTNVVLSANLKSLGYTPEGWDSNGVFEGCSGLRSIVLPDGVVNIGYGTFNGCENLASIIIPDSVTSIGSYAFEGCSGLASVTIGNGVTSIGESAFEGCNDWLYDTMTMPGVKLVDGWAVGHTDSLPDNLDLAGARGIGPNAFYGCSQLKVVKIPDSILSIGKEAFGGCVGVQDFIVDASNRSYKSSNGFLMAADGTSILYVPEGRSDIVIPDGVTRIGRYLFFDCENLMSVTMPDTVTIIEDGAFSYCTRLTNVVLSANLKSLGYTPEGWEVEGVFEGCSSLRSIVLPDGMESIGSGSFYCCEDLTSITIPDSVTSIGNYAFYGCRGLTSIVFEGNAPNGVDDAFDSDLTCTVYVSRGSTGWGVEIPGIWNGMRIEYAEEASPDTWTVTFDANGGELAVADSSRQVEDGTSLGELPVPSRLDYTFLGWFTAADGGEEVSSEVVVTSDITFYAHWQCRFSFDGGPGWTQQVDGSWRSNPTADGETNSLSMTVSGSGTIVFRRKTSCEGYFNFKGMLIRQDGISLIVDGDERTFTNGVMSAWAECSLAVEGDGCHDLVWAYIKDSSGFEGADCAWLDSVVWTPSVAAEGVAIQVNGAAIAFETAADGNTRTATVAAGTTLEDVKVFVGGVDVTKGFKVSVEGTTATVVLKAPYEAADATSASIPWTDNGDGSVTLNVEVVPGLYYAADSAAMIESLKCPGVAEPAKTGDVLTLPKQEGAHGFYKVWVSDAPIAADD